MACASVASGAACSPLGGNSYWTVTDRGPNGEIGDARTFLVPDFTPTLVRIKVQDPSITVDEAVPITTPDGDPVTGLPNLADPGRPAADRGRRRDVARLQPQRARHRRRRAHAGRPLLAGGRVRPVHRRGRRRRTRGRAAPAGRAGDPVRRGRRRLPRDGLAAGRPRRPTGQPGLRGHRAAARRAHHRRRAAELGRGRRRPGPDHHRARRLRHRHRHDAARVRLPLRRRRPPSKPALGDAT